MRRMGIGLGVGINRSNYAQDSGIFVAYESRVIADGGVVEAGQCVDAVTGLLLNASLLLIPSGYKGGKLYAEIPTNGNGDLTWTRGSDAFRTNASGVLQRVPWNLLRYSEEFNNAVWIKTATTITSNTITAPNGTLTADKLVSTSVSSSHSIYQNLGSVGDTRVISCFVKKAEYRYITLQYGTASVRFDFDTLTFSGGTSNSYTNEGNGWYRISCLLTATVNARVTILIPDNSGNVTYTGDDVSGTFIWGAQIVAGTTAQTYLPTTDRLGFPRLDYTYGSCPSALLEPQRTNLVFPSDTATTQTRTVTATAHTLSFYGTGTVVLSGVATATLAGTGANNRVTLTFTPTAGSLILTITGTVTNWQLEAGAYATTYISTTSATATRVADSAVKTGISSLIGQTEGTMFLEMIPQTAGTGVNAVFLGNSAASSSDFVYVGKNGSNCALVFRSGNNTLLNATTAITGSLMKCALAYKSGDLVAYVNGVQIAANANTFTLTTTLSTINITSAFSLGSVNETNLYQKIALFPNRLTNAELQVLTTL